MPLEREILLKIKAAERNLNRKIIYSHVFEWKAAIDFLDCVHTMPAHFENDEKCDGSKI